MNRTRALITAAAAAALVAGTVAVADAATASGSGVAANASACRYGEGPVGTWHETVDPVGPPPAFTSLVQFHADGTMVDAVSSTPVNPAIAALHPDGATSGLGSWTRSGDGFRFAFDRFITHGGSYVVRQHIEGAMTVSADCLSQSGTASVTFSDPAGNVLAQGKVDTSGTRLMP